MPMKRSEFEDLDPVHQQRLIAYAGALGISNVLYLNPDDGQPTEPSQPASVAKPKPGYTAEGLELPDDSERKKLAETFGVSAASIYTRQDQERDQIRDDLQRLIEARDSVTIINKFGNHEDPDLRQRARDAVNQMWPSYQSVIGWR